MTINIAPIAHRKLGAKASYDVAEFIKTVGTLTDEGLFTYDKYWDDARVAEKLNVTRHNVAYARNQFIGPIFIKDGSSKGAAASEIKQQLKELNNRLTSLERQLGVAPPVADARGNGGSAPSAGWFGGRSK